MGSTLLEIYKNDDKTYTLTFTNASGTAIDITGYTVFLTVKEAVTDVDASAKIAKTVTSHSDPTNGITTVTVSKTDTAQTPGDYYYDIQLKDASDNIVTCVSGTFRVIQDITTRTVAL